MMEVLVSHLLLSVLFGATGLCAGWWLHSRLPDQRSFVGMNDEGLIRELLAGLHGLSTRMAVDVNEHTTEMDAVDRELKQVQANSAETAVVNELVGRLLSANQSVQTKLTQTEGKLDELSHKMEHHASEARIDMLTGLANRRAFQEESHRSLSRFYEADEPFALVMIDIDRFKQVNDVHGHPFGDEVLRHVGEILLDQFRGCDLVSRYGGEEFAIIMPATRLGEARQMAEKLREKVATTGFTCSDISLNLTVSVGAAEILPNEDVSGVINRVDQAMYAAKRAGRNRSYWHDGTLSHPFNTSLNESASERNGEAGEGRAATGSAGPAPPRDAGTVSPVEPEGSPQAGSKTAGEENADPKPSQATDEDVELLHNFCNKTMFCQDLRRRIAKFDAGGVSFSCILVRMDDSEKFSGSRDMPLWKAGMETLAQTIQHQLRDRDLVARYDDYTFGVVLPDASLRNAVCTGEKLRKAVRETRVPTDADDFQFTISLGVVEVEDGDQMAMFIERARQELEKAQKSGGDRTGFSPQALVTS